MDLPRNLMADGHLTFSAESKWCTKDTNGDFYSMGMRIVKMNPDAVALVQSSRGTSTGKPTTMMRVPGTRSISDRQTVALTGCLGAAESCGDEVPAPVHSGRHQGFFADGLLTDPALPPRTAFAARGGRGVRFCPRGRLRAAASPTVVPVAARSVMSAVRNRATTAHAETLSISNLNA